MAAEKTAQTTKKSKRGILKPPVTSRVTEEGKEIVLAVPPMKAPKFLQGFMDFVRTQGVVGLAVGLVLGVAAKSVVDSLVANIFNPIIGLIGADGGSLDGKFICLRHGTQAVDNELVITCSNKLGYGNVLSNIISFLIVAAVVYFVVKGLKLDKIDKPKG
jgi:large conductance mechanosensitive channel